MRELLLAMSHDVLGASLHSVCVAILLVTSMRYLKLCTSFLVVIE
jgi:hypothetical protein